MAGLDQVIAAALALVGTPYQLGGLRQHPNDPRKGLDCSELIALAFAKIGIQLPWNAQEQANATTPVTSPQPGDLVFFHSTDPSNTAQYITHVGLYLGGGKMVNAENKGVAVSDITSGYWKEHLAGFGRVKGTGGAVGEPVGLPGLPGWVPKPQNPLDRVGEFVERLQDRDTWVRSYLVIGGAAVLLVGAALALWPVGREAAEVIL